MRGGVGGREGRGEGGLEGGGEVWREEVSGGCELTLLMRRDLLGMGVSALVLAGACGGRAEGSSENGDDDIVRIGV